MSGTKAPSPVSPLNAKQPPAPRKGFVWHPFPCGEAAEPPKGQPRLWGLGQRCPARACLTHRSLVLQLKVGRGLRGPVLMAARLGRSDRRPCRNQPEAGLFLCIGKQAVSHSSRVVEGLLQQLILWGEVMRHNSRNKVWKLEWIRKPGPLNSVMKPYPSQMLIQKNMRDYLLVRRNNTIYQATLKYVAHISNYF